MVYRYVRGAAPAFAALLLCSVQAFAWGPTAQRAIVGTAFQVIGRGFADPFKTTDYNYEKDVLAGAEAGRSVLNTEGQLTSNHEVLIAIGTQIQLLREVRREGSGGSYFAYRMGVLAALASDVMFPLTFENDTAGVKLCKQVEEDIDKHLRSYMSRTNRPQLEYIRNPAQYFDNRKAQFADARKLYESDYLHGEGYKGYASSSAPTLIQSTVDAVADCWFTVMRPEGDVSDVKPSERSLTEYFMQQVIYQLTEKKNLREAEHAYKQFAEQHSTSLAAYERIGDAFYAFNTPESRERGVQEWTNALTLNGPERSEVMKKLARHYLGLGKDFLGQASKPNAPKDALPNALANFTKALEFDQSNADAAQLINETQIKIAERDQRLELAIRTLSAAEAVVKQAEQSKVDQQYAEAIAQYKKAVAVFEQVGDEFKEQAGAAETGKEDAKLRISQIIKTVLDLASDRIEDGDRLVDQKQFDDAINQYNSVETLLKVVPEDLQGSQSQEKQTLLDQAAAKVQDAEKAKRAEEQLQKNKAAVSGSRSQ